MFAQSESTCFLLTFPPEAHVCKQLTQQPKTKGRRGVEHAAMKSFELTQKIYEKNMVKITLKFNKRPKKNLESMNHQFFRNLVLCAFKVFMPIWQPQSLLSRTSQEMKSKIDVLRWYIWLISTVKDAFKKWEEHESFST